MRKILATSAVAWNLILVLGVIFNQEYALTRAAGGQFEDFPIGIRLAYVLSAALVIWQYRTLINIWSQTPLNPRWLPKLFLGINLLGALVNAISQSSNERWNAIPALILAHSFWSARKATSLS